MGCDQHNLEQDFSGCYICSECGRIWIPAQPEQYNNFIKTTMDYDQPESNITAESSMLQE